MTNAPAGLTGFVCDDLSAFFSWILFCIVYHCPEMKQRFDSNFITATVFTFPDRVVRIYVCALIYLILRCFVLLRTHLLKRALFGETPSSPHGKPAQTHWSRSGRDPCPLERVASPQSFFDGGSG